MPFQNYIQSLNYVPFDHRPAELRDGDARRTYWQIGLPFTANKPTIPPKLIWQHVVTVRVMDTECGNSIAPLPLSLGLQANIGSVHVDRKSVV